jgi:uncharacterized protein (DUF736 family)
LFAFLVGATGPTAKDTCCPGCSRKTPRASRALRERKAKKFCRSLQIFCVALCRFDRLPDGQQEIAIGAVSFNNKETNMKIGHFWRHAETNGYRGHIIALQFVHYGILFRPVEKSSDKAPDYRLIVPNEYWEDREIGAAWLRVGENNRTFLSVVLDDPTFSAPINAALFFEDDNQNG